MNNNRIFEFLKRYLGPAVIGSITVDGYRRQIYSHDKNLENLKLKNAQNLEDANARAEKAEALKDSMDKLAADRYNHVEAGIYRLEQIKEEMLIIDEKIAGIDSKLLTKKFESGETSDSVLRMKEWFVRERSFKFRSHETEIQELKDSRSALDKINKSDVLDWFWEFIEKYKLFLDTLNPDQIVAIYNIIGYIMIFNALTAIGSILISNYFLQKWNLEEKFPRFSKFLKIRAKISQATLRLHIVILFSLIFINIGVNIYMFSLRYFI